MKKLIYIVNEYSNNSVQHFYHTINLLNVLAEKGVETTLIIEKCIDIPSFESDKVHVIAQKEKGVKRALELAGILRKLAKSGYHHAFVRISTTATIVSIIQGWVSNIKVFYWNCGDNTTYDRQKKGLDKLKWLVQKYSKLCFIRKFTYKFVTGPESMIDYYIKELYVKPEKMLLIYNDIDTSRFTIPTQADRDSIRDELGIPRTSKIVLFIHRLTPVKRFYLQIPYVAETDVFEKENAYLVVIGSGPDEKQIVSQIENSKYKDRIIKLGAMPNKEVQRYYKAADIFINPSYSEGFPRVCIEAMGCGIPVVATDVGGTIDLFAPEQKKYIIDKDDRDKFRASVCELLMDDEKRKKLGQINRKEVDKFSTENVANMYIEGIFNE